METHFQKELQELKEDLFKMAALVEGSDQRRLSSPWSKGIRILPRRPLKERTGSTRWRLPSRISCLKLLALRQPMAADLRFITSAMKIVTDLGTNG